MKGLFAATTLLVGISLCVGCSASQRSLEPTYPTLHAGDLVRISLRQPGSELIRGRFTGVDSADTLRLSGGATAVHLSEVRAIEVRRGDRDYGGEGALLGALVGAVGGGMIGSTQGDGFFFTDEEMAAMYALIGGVGGAVVGYIVGTLVGKERWVHVPKQTLRSPDSSK